MKKAAQYRGLGSYGTIGIEIVLSIGLGTWIGSKLDAWLDTAPWMAVLWFGFGCAAATRAVYRSWKEMQAAAKREEAVEGNPPQQFPDEKSKQWQREEEELAREVEKAGQGATDQATRRDG